MLGRCPLTSGTIGEPGVFLFPPGMQSDKYLHFLSAPVFLSVYPIGFFLLCRLNDTDYYI